MRPLPLTSSRAQELRAGLRRLLVLLIVALAGTAAISAALGALAGKNVPHAVALGYYLVGSAILLGSLAFGIRGPNRIDRSAQEEDEDPEDYRPGPLGVLGGVSTASRVRRRRNLRRATPEERRNARLTSLGLFAFGVLIILLGASIDPTHRAF